MNRILIVCGIVLTTFLAGILVGFKPSTGFRTDGGISKMISNIDPAQIQNTVNTLAGTFTHSHARAFPRQVKA